MAVYPGRSVFIKADLNNVGGAGASWTKIGQQRDGGLKRTTETADATHKDDLGYPSAVITRTPWSVSCEGALNPLDAAWAFLLSAWSTKTKVWIQIDESAIGGEKMEGASIITNLSKTYPEGDLVAFSAEFQGDGALVTSVL